MQPFAFLDHPLVWRLSRLGLDLALGIYRRRIRTLQRWGVLEGNPSVLDIGCGIGQYAAVTKGPYLGIDLNSRYVRYAEERYAGSNRRFRCEDATRLADAGEQYDFVLLVDFLHHIPDAEAVRILRVAAQVARRGVLSFEPVLAQTNPVGRWIIAHDRGDHIRPLEGLHGLFQEAGLRPAESCPLALGVIQTHAIFCDLQRQHNERGQGAAVPQAA
jgi:SAM-dependent methyltransferase